MSELVYSHTDDGYCRVYYTYENKDGQTCHYCAQEEYKGAVQFYRCTDEPWLEPDYPVKLKILPPKSPGDSETDRAVNAWIDTLDLQPKEAA
jgi:hypothetical protein